MSKITKTTAINDYNTAVVKQSGRVGTVRYYTKNGLTYVRAACYGKSSEMFLIPARRSMGDACAAAKDN